MSIQVHNHTREQQCDGNCPVKPLTLAEEEKDVHTEHCCFVHGCKYGKDDECSVVTGKKKQSHPCESCDYDEEMNALYAPDLASLRQQLAEKDDEHRSLSVVWVIEPSNTSHWAEVSRQMSIIMSDEGEIGNGRCHQYRFTARGIRKLCEFHSRVEAAEKDALLVDAMDVIQQTVWSLEDYEKQHNVMFAALIPLRAVLARGKEGK